MSSVLPLEFVVLLVVSVFLYRAVRRPVTQTPGPGGYPLIGLTLNALKGKPLDTLAHWHTQFGPMVFTKILGKPVVFLSGLEVADQLLNKRCAVLSDRPMPVMASLCEYDRALVFLPQGSRYMRTRRQMNSEFNARAIPSHYAHLADSVKLFITHLLNTPSDFHRHISIYYSSAVLTHTIGLVPQSEDDLIVNLSQRIGHNATSMMSLRRKYWVEFFPIARYLPAWCTGKKMSSVIYSFRDDLRDLLALCEAYVNDHLDDPAVATSFLGKLLQNCPSEEERSIATFSSVSVYGGATDTVVSLTTSFFVAMMLCPEAQRRAQAEIDAVVGRQRLPTFSDRASLPYTGALVTELMRWAPPIPFTSRTLAEDLVDDKFVLGAGTTVVANIWGMLHDPARFADPDRFRPERFYAPDEGRDAAFLEDSRRYVKRVVFGFGRRVCPGRFYADAWLWIVLASVLATVKVSSPDGKPVQPPTFEPSAIIQLPPFACKLEPRFEGASGLVSA